MVGHSYCGLGAGASIHRRARPAHVAGADANANTVFSRSVALLCRPVAIDLNASITRSGRVAAAAVSATTRTAVTTVGSGSEASSSPGKKVIIVGAGWAGFGAAKHLCEQGYEVKLLDASPNPGGLSAGWRTPQGKAVEAGMKGFWYQYHNIFALVKELGLSPFTEFTPSGFWGPKGLLTEAPVFQNLTRLPTLLGQFVHTSALFQGLPLADRLTMLPLLYSIVDYDTSPAQYLAYDQMSARELFRASGVSQRLYEEFLKPLLLVGLFAPPEELSAAVTIGTLYFYSLAHQNDFDVCWCKGSVAELIFQPLLDRIKSQGGQVLGNQLVVDLGMERSGAITRVVAKDRATGTETVHEADAIVFAIGITGMQKLVAACEPLGQAEEFRRVMNLKGIDVLSTRLWFDRRVPTRFPANVLSGFEADLGATFFNLNSLQDEYKDAEGSVIAADVYHSNTMMPLSDEQVVAKLKSWIEACEPGFKSANVVDSAVLRFPKAVTHFSAGSYTDRPFQHTSFPNLYLAGDWVKGLPHGSNGLSQERAYVTGLVAANMVIDRLGHGDKARILNTEPDEQHVATAKAVNRQAREALSTLGIRSPFL